MHYFIVVLIAFALSIYGCEGKTGPAGPTGSAGQTGSAGPAGPQGAMGPAGADGAQGPQGEKGDTGETGPAGPMGPAGADGAQGPQGEKGDTGETGPAGPMGPAGADGAQGPQGEQGPAGPDGAPVNVPEVIDGVIAGGILADIHHILIIQDGQDAKDARRVNSPGFDETLETVVLLVDDTTSLVAKAGTQSGDPVAATFSWDIEDGAFADVDASGTVTGVSNGSTNIMVSVEGRGIEVSIPLTVYKAVDNVVVTADGSGTLRVGGTVGLTARAYDESDADEGVLIPGIEFVWESSDTDVATVKDGDNGMATVTAKGAGTANITAMAAGTDVKSDAFEVTVFAVQGVERRLTADVPYMAEIAADSASIETEVTITATLEQKNSAGEWENAPDGSTVTFSVVSGPVFIATAQAMPTTISGDATLALTSQSNPEADPVVTGINGEGTAIIRISSRYATTIYVEVEITQAESN